MKRWFRVCLIALLATIAVGCVSNTSTDLCSTLHIERRPLITGKDANIMCILNSNIPLESVVDVSIFGAKPTESLRSTLERLAGPVETKIIDGVNWFVATGPRARREIGCLPIRSGGADACVWQISAYPLSPRGDVLHRELIQIVQREVERMGHEGSITLSVESRESSPGPKPYYRARYIGDTLKVLEWRDESIPRDFMLPASSAQQPSRL